MTIDKKALILNAQLLGFFKVKTAEKRDVILAELMQLEEFPESDKAQYVDILEGEIFRRQAVYQHKQALAVAKAQADAEKPLTAGMDSATDHIQARPAGRYVLTVAQNNTDVDSVFLAALLQYCEANNAQLLVAKSTYNKNGFQQSQDVTEGIYYDPAITGYIVEGQISLGGKLDFVAQANVLPTAKNPLSGFEGITETGVHVVIPASKIALKCTAALKGGDGKILYSTGTVTKRNYIMRKAGAVAASEHNIGALFVDTTGNTPVCRQLELMPGSNGFYDEGNYYNANGVVHDVTPIALQFGDIHAEKMEPRNLEKLCELIGYYQPQNIILHDVMDFSSRNHHNVKDCAFMFAQTIQGNTVAQDVVKVAKVIDTLADAGLGIGRVHIIESNHDLAINTWLKNADFKDDPVNALTYLECMTALYKHIDAKGNTDFNMLKFAYEKIGGGVFGEAIRFHGTDESVIMAGVEMGCHGHTGTNGSRGSPAQFRALGIKLNTGHTHTPSIMGGCYTAGVTGSLDMGYNIGASSWKLANVLTWPNGQRQVIFM